MNLALNEIGREVWNWKWTTAEWNWKRNKVQGLRDMVQGRCALLVLDLTDNAYSTERKAKSTEIGLNEIGCEVQYVR